MHDNKTNTNNKMGWYIIREVVGVRKKKHPVAPEVVGWAAKTTMHLAKQARIKFAREKLRKTKASKIEKACAFKNADVR